MVTQMIQVYCRGKHHTKGKMCSECQVLSDYANMRSDKCPFMETKTFCSNCKVHCYKPEMREKSGGYEIFRTKNDISPSCCSYTPCNTYEKGKEADRK